MRLLICFWCKEAGKTNITQQIIPTGHIGNSIPNLALSCVLECTFLLPFAVISVISKLYMDCGSTNFIIPVTIVTHKNKSMRYGKAQNLMNAILQRCSNHGEIKHRKLEIPKQVKFEHIDVSKFSNRKLFEANSVSKETANNLNDLIKHDILLA